MVRAFEPGDVVAYSLREAAARVSAGASSPDLVRLAGITRFAGFVYDARAGDIILVGKVLPQKPAITLDDLVVGLKARLDQDGWPLVSIDPTGDTEHTGLQAVRLEGGIADTAWGRDFVKGDVGLKHYCLKMLDGPWLVKSYRDYYEDHLRELAHASGAEVTNVSWFKGVEAEDVARTHLGQGVRGTNFTQCKFWIYSTTNQQPFYWPVDRGGVFCIKELRLGVLAEQDGVPIAAGSSSPGARFAGAFSDAFDALTVHEPLSRFKGLFDVISIAEAIRTAELKPVVSRLLATYRVAYEKTEPTSPLEELVGEVHRNDGALQLVHLAGGVSFRTQIKSLQDGSLTPLYVIVTRSRPSTGTLAWRLPLDSWKMPNLDAADGASRPLVSYPDYAAPGSHLAGTLVGLLPPGQQGGAGTPKFDGFSRVSGIRFGHTVAQEEFERDQSGFLRGVKARGAQSRPSTNALGWDAK